MKINLFLYGIVDLNDIKLVNLKSKYKILKYNWLLNEYRIEIICLDWTVPNNI